MDWIDDSAKGGIHYTMASRTLRFDDGQKEMIIKKDIKNNQSEVSLIDLSFNCSIDPIENHNNVGFLNITGITILYIFTQLGGLIYIDYKNASAKDHVWTINIDVSGQWTEHL